MLGRGRKPSLSQLSGNGYLGTPWPFNTLNKGDFNSVSKNLHVFLRKEENTILHGVLAKGMANTPMARTGVTAVLIPFFLNITKEFISWGKLRQYRG